MLSGEFVKLVTFSAILAAPIAWYIMNLWLENFAFRTPITWWMMAAAGLVVLVLSIITVSTQAIRSAMVNPVKSLKSE
jgi:putative ABC transport system permease protein